MSVRAFSGTDPDYDKVLDLPDSYSIAVGRAFVVKRKINGDVSPWHDLLAMELLDGEILTAK